jgi:hypothetical protein
MCQNQECPRFRISMILLNFTFFHVVTETIVSSFMYYKDISGNVFFGGDIFNLKNRWRGILKVLGGLTFFRYRFTHHLFFSII